MRRRVVPDFCVLANMSGLLRWGWRSRSLDYDRAAVVRLPRREVLKKR
jgi:hypothetical protein